MNGGKGSVESPTTCGGKVSCRKCLGALKCTDNNCPVVVRPVTGGPAKIREQLTCSCQCGGGLKHIQCASRSTTIQWGQIGDDISTRKYRYINGAEHNHSRFPNPA